MAPVVLSGITVGGGLSARHESFQTKIHGIAAAPTAEISIASGVRAFLAFNFVIRGRLPRGLETSATGLFFKFSKGPREPPGV